MTEDVRKPAASPGLATLVRRLPREIEPPAQLWERIAARLELRVGLGAQVGALPREITPPRDLWPAIAARVDGLDAEGLRAVADTLRDRLGSGVVCVGSVTDGKVSLIAAVTNDLTKRFQAGRIVQAVAQAVGGRGGGRPDLAQGGGAEPDKLDGALNLVYDLIARVPA